jgi:hypothetical protein
MEREPLADEDTTRSRHFARREAGEGLTKILLFIPFIPFILVNLFLNIELVDMHEK